MCVYIYVYVYMYICICIYVYVCVTLPSERLWCCWAVEFSEQLKGPLQFVDPEATDGGSSRRKVQGLRFRV